MPLINIVTSINAPIERCFDLCCSIDLHSISTSNTKEKAIAGKTSGIITLNETVTWQAFHLGIKQKLTSKITEYNRPYSFVDQQVKGAFKSLHHRHTFEEKNGMVIMTDYFNYESPLGVLGKIFNKIYLTKYLTNFLTSRNQIVKDYAETDKWKTILK